MKSEKKIRVLMADDHQLMREGLLSLLNTTNDIEVVGAVRSGEDAVNSAFELKPDVIVMDIVMKGISGIEAARWIKEQNGDIKILLISMSVNKEYLSAGIKCGVDGYLPKDCPKEALVQGIRSIYSGNKYFPDDIKKMIFDEFCYRQIGDDPAKTILGNELTKREHEILALVASGKGNKEIGEKLFISVKTVDTHKSHILEKLGLKNTLELVRYAIRKGILTA